MCKLYSFSVLFLCVLCFFILLFYLVCSVHCFYGPCSMLPDTHKWMNEQQVFSWAHQSRLRKRHLDRFIRFWRDHQVWEMLEVITDWQTVVGNNRPSAQCRSKILLLSLRLQQVFIGAVDSTYRINFSNQQLYSAVRPETGLTGCSVCGDTLQYKLEESVPHRRTRQVLFYLCLF